MEYLLCPNCKHPLSFAGNSYFCQNCKSQFEIRQGIPVLLPKTISQATSLEAEAWNNKNSFRAEVGEPPWKTLSLRQSDIQTFLDGMRHVKFDGKILEVGGGSGWASAIVKFYYPSSEVYATDVAVSALVKAKEVSRVFNVNVDKYMVVDIQSAPFPDDYFDVVFGCSMLHHIPSLAEGLAEIHRILKPGGTYFGMGEPMATRLLQHIAITLRVNPPKLTKEGVQENIYTFGEWQKFFKVAGFEWLNILICKDPIYYKATKRLRLLYYLIINKMPNFIMSRLLGCGIYIIAKKTGTSEMMLTR